MPGASDNYKMLLTEKKKTIRELLATLRAVKAILDQPVQYTSETENMYGKISILQGDCKLAREFITNTLEKFED